VTQQTRVARDLKFFLQHKFRLASLPLALESDERHDGGHVPDAELN
jgi:hypothetical protein